MSLLGKLFNRAPDIAEEAPGAVAVSPAGHVSNVSSVRGGYRTGKAPEGGPEGQDAELAKLIGVKYRAGRPYISPLPLVTAAMLDHVIAEAKPLSADDERQAVELAAKWKRADEQMQDYSFTRVGNLIRAALPAIDAAIQQGKEPPALPSYKERQMQTVSVRASIHAHKAELSRKMAELLKPACDRFYRAAKQIVTEQHRKETTGFSRFFRVDFKPSMELRGFTWIMLQSYAPILDFRDVGFLPPTPDPRQIWGFLVTEQAPAGPVVDPRKEFFQNQRDIAREQDKTLMEAERLQREEQARKISEFNDKIRLQSRAEAEGQKTGYDSTKMQKPK